MRKFYVISLTLLIVAVSSFLIFKMNLKSLPNPSRNPEEGCKWERIVGKEIELWGQRCDHAWVKISDTLPGIVEEIKLENGKIVPFRYVQIFNLKNQVIEDVIPFLRKGSEWKDSDLCQFKKLPSTERKEVSMYILMPTGKALEKFEKEGREYPITTTCGGYGAGNSGNLWFEIHASNPKKALFFSNSQENPLYDEKSIIVK